MRNLLDKIRHVESLRQKVDDYESLKIVPLIQGIMVCYGPCR